MLVIDASGSDSYAIGSNHEGSPDAPAGTNPRTSQPWCRETRAFLKGRRRIDALPALSTGAARINTTLKAPRRNVYLLMLMWKTD